MCVCVCVCVKNGWSTDIFPLEIGKKILCCSLTDGHNCVYIYTVYIYIYIYVCVCVCVLRMAGQQTYFLLRLDVEVLF